MLYTGYEQISVPLMCQACMLNLANDADWYLITIWIIVNKHNAWLGFSGGTRYNDLEQYEVWDKASHDKIKWRQAADETSPMV